jgi:undecaprenyl-diphosphatase
MTAPTSGFHHPVRGRWLVAFVSAVAVAVTAGIVARAGEVPGWEQGAFHGINGLPDWLRSPMWLFGQAGLVLLPVGLALVACAVRRFRLALALVLLIPAKLAVEHGVVKVLVERHRPGTSICHGDATCGNFRDVPIDGLSFVSGHAIIAWGIATIVWPYLPGRWKWAPVGIAVLNSMARVYLGAHNPLDVIGGGAIGVALGVLLSVAVGVPASSAASGEPAQEPSPAALDRLD